jgi:hypothetical protein
MQKFKELRLEEKDAVFIQRQIKYWEADPTKNAQHIQAAKMILKRKQKLKFNVKPHRQGVTRVKIDGKWQEWSK